ncbi:hypothetical protein EMIHUDRAFT_458800 [Emiliania huxleyi CCMP1516]|uniref:Glycerol-3-phosphate dehydrogenase NAD-dependent N-terminal domain-containing protein n=4 Tax=Emiliania huxleyi TaxID=2903 RepID=A0A0D3J6L9_EMIH1|nr:hypothetical protein EMIHUDRAFT_458800 [Emiliania huxleyi CCMP1516]EOD19154.1 hypothetical protein EMIHUDRAFT_458800 [Emiliania huxleyi CCMP1516]|eukprot:XP_005771583.1 hypothetical protein EMIHUDRAFT_458800 [Emiliania huxleyi CCMP1516]
MLSRVSKGLARPGSRLLSGAAGSEKLAMVGSGNFGSALVRILGQNALRHDIFDNEVKLYVYEEMIDGKPLTEIINETNENVKYLKGAKFTPNVKAVPDLAEAVKGATMVCFCLPHQFLKPLMPTIKESVAPGAKRRFGHAAGRVAQLSALLLIACHWSGCLWWLVGTTGCNIFDDDPAACDDGWGPSSELQAAGLRDKYAVAFLWGASLMTCLVPFDTLDAKRGHVLKRLELIQSFLARSDVPEGLQRQVLDFFTYRLSSSQQAMHEIGSDLAGLPRELSLRLTMALYGDLLQHCPFFRPLSSSAVVALVQQLQPMVCMPGQLLEVNHILKMKNLEHEFPFFTTVYKISYEDAPFSALTETPVGKGGKPDRFTMKNFGRNPPKSGKRKQEHRKPAPKGGVVHDAVQQAVMQYGYDDELYQAWRDGKIGEKDLPEEPQP